MIPTLQNFDSALQIATQRHMAGDRASAERLYMQLMPLQPNHAFLNFALGTFYTDSETMGLAIPLLMRACELDPSNAQAWNNLGAAFKAGFQHTEAETCLVKAHELDPKNAAVYANYSGLYINEGCPDRALKWTKPGLLIDPDSPQLHNHTALANLELGDWQEAWPHWEWRTKLPGWFQRDFPAPTKLWHGQPTRNLALSGEQGIGDEILFCSILPEVRPLVSGRLIIECTERLQRLFERSFDCITYPSHQEVLFYEHEIDHHLQLGSLPRLFRPTPDHCTGKPFLKVDEATVEEMRARLAKLGPPPYVGLAWRGGTKKTHGHVRQIALADLDTVRAVPGCTFVSVQYGTAAIEAATHHLPHFADAVIDFDRHTALIAACDLVISVCQTAVHQSGGLGIPCWCLTPWKVAWRYGVWGGERMPWYDCVRLFRQAADQQWAPVVQRTVEELQIWLKERSA